MQQSRDITEDVRQHFQLASEMEQNEPLEAFLDSEERVTKRHRDALDDFAEQFDESESVGKEDTIGEYLFTNKDLFRGLERTANIQQHLTEEQESVYGRRKSEKNSPNSRQHNQRTKKRKQSRDLEDELIDITSTDDEMSRRTKRASVSTNQNSDTLTVELLFVVDVSLYYWWGNLTTLLETQDVKTRDIIQEYYGYMFQGIDERLQSMASQGISINAAFAGLIVAKSEEESFWTTTSVIEDENGGHRQMVNASEALEKFQVWLDNNTGLPHYDHAILFTGTNLTYAGSPGNTGLAFGSSLCLNMSNSSIVEDQLDIRTITFATQQVARSLGSNDDMDNNDCLEFFNYLMAPKLKLPIRSFASNRWKFSTCSQQYIKDYLNGLNEAGLNCLSNTSVNPRYPPSIDFVLESPLGKNTTAKRQCQLRFGVNSDICRMRIGTGYNKICSGLPCSFSDGESCDYILPADGTPCGNRKYCWEGQCQMFQDAADASDTCVFGNDPHLDCDEKVLNNTSLCYKETVRYSCCSACELVALGIPGCEYGDRVNDCGVQECVYGDETYSRTSCCLTCLNGPTPYSPPLKTGELENITQVQPTYTLPTSLHNFTLSSASTNKSTGLELPTNPALHMLTTTTQTLNTNTTKGELQSSTMALSTAYNKQSMGSTKAYTYSLPIASANDDLTEVPITTYTTVVGNTFSSSNQHPTLALKDITSCICQSRITTAIPTCQTSESAQTTTGSASSHHKGN